MTPISNSTPDDRVIAFVYDNPSYGRLVVEQHVPDVPVDAYLTGLKSLVASNGDPELHGSFALEPLANGNVALVTTSEDGHVAEVWWLQNRTFEVIVRGPTLQSAEAALIAKNTSAAINHEILWLSSSPSDPKLPKGAPLPREPA